MPLRQSESLLARQRLQGKHGGCGNRESKENTTDGGIEEGGTEQKQKTSFSSYLPPSTAGCVCNHGAALAHHDAGPVVTYLGVELA